MAAELQDHEHGDLRWKVIATNNPTSTPERIALIDADVLAGLISRLPHDQPDEDVTLNEDWDFHLREGDYPDRNRGAVLISGGDCCCGGTHTRDYTPAKARRIAARLVALADEAEKVEPARLLTQEEADAR